MNIRKLLYKTKPQRSYFNIYDSTNKLVTVYVKRILPEFNALQNYYKKKLLLEHGSLKPYENNDAYVIRYYHVMFEHIPKIIAFCKVKDVDGYFFICKETIKEWKHMTDV